MSSSGVLASTEPSQTTVGAARRAATRSRVHSEFSLGMSVGLLLIVLVGFSRTLYMRAIFDVPEFSAYLLLHGCVLTAWFVGILLQTTLVTNHRTDIIAGWVG